MLTKTATRCQQQLRLVTFHLGKFTGGDQSVVVDALEDVLVQLLGLWTIKGHTQYDESVCQALQHHKTQ